MQNQQQHLLKKAFRVIRRNYGCPGNDGISISDIKKSYCTYENLLYEKLKNNKFVFEQNPKQVVIRDYLGKEREIFVYNVSERWAQEFLKLQIEETIEKNLVEYTYAFRRGKSDKDSYRNILSTNPVCILRTDIKNYFRSISKVSIFLLLEKFAIGRDLLYLIRKVLGHCEQGLPPGNALSCILSNISLSNFDIRFPQNYTRYSDDMIFVAKNMIEAEILLEKVTALLEMYGFSINKEKTRIIINPTLSSLS